MEVDLPEKEENPHVCRWVWPFLWRSCTVVFRDVLLRACVRACVRIVGASASVWNLKWCELISKSHM